MKSERRRWNWKPWRWKWNRKPPNQKWKWNRKRREWWNERYTIYL